MAAQNEESNEQTLAAGGPAQREAAAIAQARRAADDMLGSAVERLRNAPQIDGYEFARELHRGGQGVVYQALEKATKRKVAIKILLEGHYASDSARKRFEREIELAASLKHPNIVAVFHSGVTQDDRQFCVMDYIRGVPLHHYVRDQKLPLDEALKLFAKVCDAVNYANQKGVIHRDLKPSNILVDTEGSPKVLDFGLARQVGGPEQAVVSVTGEVVGTLQYMSPEQTRGNPDEIDIRTDVYSLGVVLYEMLTGHFPYPVIGQLVDVIKHIAGTEPAPPSRTWRADSGVTQRSGTRTSKRAVCPIDSDLQTIVLRALAKDRKRRYQTAADLGADIEHYLNDEPIEARRDSALYVLRKRLRRYRIAVTVVVLVAALSAAVTMGVLRERKHRRQRAEDLVTQSLPFVGARDYAKAESLLQQALTLDTENYTAIMNLATIKRYVYEEGRDSRVFDEALALMDRGALIAPHRVEPHNLKGIFLRNAGRLDEAVAALNHAIALDSNYFATYVTLANTLVLKNDWQAAELALRNADALPVQDMDDRPWHRWHNLAVVQAALNRPEAVETLKKARRHSEGKYASPHVLVTEARIKLWLGPAFDPARALDSIITAETLAGESGAVQQWRFKRLRALAELRKENWPAASVAAKEALAVTPHDPRSAQPQLIAAIADAKRGARPEAEQHLQAAIVAWPADLEAAPNGIIGAVEPGGLLWYESIAEFKALRQEAEALLGPVSTPATQPANSDKNPQS